MYNLVDYVNSWWYSPEQNPSEPSAETSPESSPKPVSKPVSESILDSPVKIHFPIKKKGFITPQDLLKVKLKPRKDIIPAPARNMPPIDRVSLYSLNKAQLKAILSVKLRKVDVKPRKNTFAPRHPVLRELLLKHQRVK